MKVYELHDELPNDIKEQGDEKLDEKQIDNEEGDDDDGVA